MAFFSEGQNRVKLMLLYVIKCFRVPVTRDQIFTAFSAVDGTDYFTVCELLSELENEQYMLSVPVRGRQLHYITQKGIALCEAFEVEIARSVRDEIIGVTDRDRESIRRMNCVTADARPRPDGTWDVTLSLVEKDSVIFEMSLRMPDAPSAAAAERKWLRDADSVYLGIFTQLMEDRK